MKNRNSNSKMRKNNNRKLFSNNKLLNNKLLNNKITLFIVTALALFSLYIHITKSNFSAVLLFFLTAALVYSFTKNMILVLGASFIVTTIASMSKNLFGLKEGFKEGADDKTDEDEKEDTTKEDTTKEDTTQEDAIVNELKNESTKKTETTNKETTNNKKHNNKQSNFDNQKLAPALFNTPSKKNVEQQLGKATEVEQAYDNLEKIMGSEKINSISSETKDLIKQQNELIKQLKTMTPALNSAMSSLGNLDLNKLTGMFNSATKNLSEMKE
uniref:Uncharacterized protein n=1 Tax=viral metagenome TaxID=1070528 RepID=A0A6C0D4C9_9ZZZZ